MHLLFLQELERNIKYLWRSRSLGLTLHRAEKPTKIYSFKYNGNPLYYRSGTSDDSALNEVLFRKGKKAEYHFEIEEEPRTILDIGGHIGLSAIYYTLLYPNAKIFSLEPFPANFEILQRNIVGYPNIKALNYGLGIENGIFPFYADSDSSNLGGYSITPKSSKDDLKGVNLATEVQIRNVGEFLAENCINVVDLIKIDTEGAEYEILTSFPPEVISKVRWIIGELHDRNDFELLAYLSKWFYIGINKEKIRFPYSIFRASNRSYLVPPEKRY